MSACEMPTTGTNPRDVEEILTKSRTIAVAGISGDPGKVSHEISAYLQENGFRLLPVNPKESEILGEKVHSDIASLPEPPDVVLVFRKPDAVPEIVDAAIARGAKAIWLQSGIVHNVAAAKAEAAGLRVVQNRCIRTEHLNRRRP